MNYSIFKGKIKNVLPDLSHSSNTVGMHNDSDDYNKIAKMAVCINNKIRDYFGNRVDDFGVEEISEDLNNITFTISFRAYESYSIFLLNNLGNYSCYFMIGGVKFNFKSAHKYLESGDYETLFSEIKHELELRLPDKFLEARGWL
ncbi:MAG: hypothetical protein J1E62_04570 [Lachnospiraceae bacterium]|nr:hypothetical protein [Lachnospiraceae bacterium]